MAKAYGRVRYRDKEGNLKTVSNGEEVPSNAGLDKDDAALVKQESKQTGGKG